MYNENIVDDYTGYSSDPDEVIYNKVDTIIIIDSIYTPEEIRNKLNAPKAWHGYSIDSNIPLYIDIEIEKWSYKREMDIMQSKNNKTKVYKLDIV